LALTCPACQEAASDTCNAPLPTSPPTTTTPTPVNAEPQPINGSKYPERVQPREDFLEEEALTETLADLPLEEKQSLGFTSHDLILDCKYAGVDCNVGYELSLCFLEVFSQVCLFQGVFYLLQRYSRELLHFQFWMELNYCNKAIDQSRASSW
jgi:hypothetical protein